MQKDIHFNLVYALARLLGIKDAELITWACWHVDKNTEEKGRDIQTQCEPTLRGNWKYREIQAMVIIPFHFPPGKTLWIVEPNSARVNKLVNAAKDPIQLGIALHAIQDSFSHQGFTGWEEPFNACYKWGFSIPLSNIGHTDLWYQPDITTAKWLDPRTGQNIDNRARVMQAAAATYGALHRWSGSKKADWPKVAHRLEGIVHIADYDQRVSALNELAGKTVRYSEMPYNEGFVPAARRHLIEFLKSI